MRAYLDWAAGAPLHPAARAAMLAVLEAGPGNPSSVHREGRAARVTLERAREAVARLLGCEPRELIFTASATEANATAVLGAARAAPDRPLVISAVEHASVRLAAAAAGVEVRLARADARGVVARAAVEEALSRGGASLVALQLANNETGVVQPVIEAAAAARSAGAHFHCDAVQAAGKIDLGPIWDRCDSLALSAHKLGGPPGIGALALRRDAALAPLVPGHQERGLRGGTPALPSIAAFGAVAELVLAEREERQARLARHTAELEAIVRAACPEAIVHGVEAERVPGIVNVRFPGVDGEALLVHLDLAGIACSHGAACSTGAMEPSPVLLAMGLTAAEARSAIRLSIGPETTDGELRLLAEVLPDALRGCRL